MKVLSIRQPWAWLIVNGFKDVENRSWPTNVRGDVLIHAAKRMDLADYNDAWWLAKEVCGETLPHQDRLLRGGIIGRVCIMGCVRQHHSPWFFGPWGFLLCDQALLPFEPCRGALGFFEIPNAEAHASATKEPIA
jgi:hypothetical protein